MLSQDCRLIRLASLKLPLLNGQLQLLHKDMQHHHRRTVFILPLTAGLAIHRSHQRSLTQINQLLHKLPKRPLKGFYR